MAENINLKSVIVRLNISQKSALAYYKGSAKWVICDSIDGKVVKFPARVLQLVINKDGVNGLYRLRFKADGVFYDITKIKD